MFAISSSSPVWVGLNADVASPDDSAVFFGVLGECRIGLGSRATYFLKDSFMKGPGAAGGCNLMALPSCTEGLNAAGRGLWHWAQVLQIRRYFSDHWGAVPYNWCFQALNEGGNQKL